MIFIDEVQDLAGFDLELIKLLFKSKSEIMLMGDPRQVTYKTHHTKKYSQYSNGNIKGFVTSEEVLGKTISCTVDEKILNKSHRCPQEICDYSSKLYPQFRSVDMCSCETCHQEQVSHQGVFIVPKHLCSEYLKKYKPMKLRWSQATKVSPLYSVMNFGESKGMTVDRAIIYPTKDMVKWIHNPSNPKLLKDEARAKFYVALTRARYSVAIILDIDDDEFEGATIYS